MAEQVALYTPGETKIVILDELISLGRVSKVNPYYAKNLFVPVYKAWDCEGVPIFDLKNTIINENTIECININNIYKVEVADITDKNFKHTMSFRSLVERYLEQVYDGNVLRYDFGIFCKVGLYDSKKNLIAYATRYSI